MHQVPLHSAPVGSGHGSDAAPSVPLLGTKRPLTVREQKLQKAAGEFESILLTTFWKSMKNSFGDTDDNPDDPAHGTLEDFAVQAMAGAVGKAGGLGIGNLILKHLSAAANAASAATGQPSVKPPHLLADIPVETNESRPAD